MSNLGDQLVDMMAAVNAGHSGAREEYRKTIAEQAAQIERLRAALRWALPLATMALEDCRQQRVKLGHTDIIGTYRNGQAWVGIHQSEVDNLEAARAALAAPSHASGVVSGALEERT